jgi:hypothetical protein
MKHVFLAVFLGLVGLSVALPAQAETQHSTQSKKKKKAPRHHRHRTHRAPAKKH